MKIAIITDGKYGDRTFSNVQTKFRDTSFVMMEGYDPHDFIDEVVLPEHVINAIKNSDLIISYIRHPDIVAEINEFKKPLIIALNFGQGYFSQIKEVNPNAVMPDTMCKLKSNTGIEKIDDYAKLFGVPDYDISLKLSEEKPPIVSYVRLISESPCTATQNSLEKLKGLELTPNHLNEFALKVSQECKEPMSILLKRTDMGASAAGLHLLCFLEALKNKYPKLFEDGTELGNYLKKARANIEGSSNRPSIF